MFSLYLYAGFYWLCYAVAAFGVSAFLFELTPKWAPFIVGGAVLSWVSKKFAEYILFREKQKVLKDQLAAYDKAKAEQEFAQDLNNNQYMN